MILEGIRRSRSTSSIKMKNLAVVAFCVVIFVAVVSARPGEEKYTDQYDNIDVDEILQTDRLRKAYFKCLKTGEQCTKEGQTLKEILPDALQNECSKCTEVQKNQTRKVFHYAIKHHPEDFKELEEIYDPDRKYRVKYADKLKEEGLVLPD